ncbi:hypothetical protein [Butyrivibrio sp. XBB1001]|uniref:hypothetical protein n=1 Tax=Butyrivibrio sp. XBB1001 TaxID=1280682 RepID=UPI000421DAB3|nr:hypothetical protein [Butyrivibrio sp. XBB1001]
MFVVTSIALWLFAARLSNRFKENIVDTAPVAAGILIMILYVLAMFRGMKWIGVISAVYIAFEVVYSFRTSTIKDVVKPLLSPIPITFWLVVAFVAFMTRSEMFTWWDDINFWSSDAKEMFFINGFPGKYGNVSPEFGDYPPVTTIWKWIFLQISSMQYRESLQFAGYFALNAMFLMPLAGIESVHGSSIKSGEAMDKTSVIGAKTCFIQIVWYIIVLLLPGVFSGIIFYGTPADITMAIIYGALLLAIVDYEKDASDVFYFGRIAVFTTLLLLTKSVGIEWAIFALIFYVLFGKKGKGIWASIAVSGGFYASWLIFCLINRRVAKLTGAGIKMAKSGYHLPENTAEKMMYFIQGFWTMPMHADHNWTLDISTGVAVVLIFAVALFLVRNKKLNLYLLFTFVVTYGVIFLAHVSIFQTEEQYLDAFAMANSLGRYGSPFTLGTSVLLIGMYVRGRTGSVCVESVEGNEHGAKAPKIRGLAPLAIAAVAILLTADYVGDYNYLYGYRNTLSEDEAAYEDMVGDEGREILEALSNPELIGKRVLVIQDGREYHWVHDAYISKELSPVAAVYDVVLNEDSAEVIADRIKKSHASYVYVVLFEDFDPGNLVLLLDEGEIYEPGAVYRVKALGDDIKLEMVR